MEPRDLFRLTAAGLAGAALADGGTNPVEAHDGAKASLKRLETQRRA